MDKQQKINSVEVIISGEIVTLSGTESEEYFHRVARYLDKKIASLQREKQVLGINSFAKTLLISVNITDDLFKVMDERDEIKEELEKYRQELGKLQQENTLLNDKISDLQIEYTNSQNALYNTKNELIQTQKDLNEYISNFDNKQDKEPPKNVYKLKNSNK